MKEQKVAGGAVCEGRLVSTVPSMDMSEGEAVMEVGHMGLLGKQTRGHAEAVYHPNIPQKCPLSLPFCSTNFFYLVQSVNLIREVHFLHKCHPFLFNTEKGN